MSCWLTPQIATTVSRKSRAPRKFPGPWKFSSVASPSFDLKIEGDKELASLTIGKSDTALPLARPHSRAELEGLAVDGVHADLRLRIGETPSEEKPPLDLKKLVETLRSAPRGAWCRWNWTSKNISFAATRDGQPVLTLAPSRISHAVREGDDLLLELGVAHRRLPVANGRAQEIHHRLESGPAISRADRSVSRRKCPASWWCRCLKTGEPSVEAELQCR